MIGVEAVIIIAGWLVSLVVALKAVPYLAAKRVSEQFGLTLVEQNGKKFYAPVDPSGEPVKIPVGITKDEEGEEKVVLGYAPLAYCLPYMAADMAAVKVKMALFNAKSQLSKKMQQEGLSQVMQGGGSLNEVLPFLPKKAQMAAALLQAALGARGSQVANNAQTPVTHSRGRSGAI